MSNVLAVSMVFGVVAIFSVIVYFMRDKLEMSDIKEILATIITSAENLIVGEKQGAVRMNEVIRVAETVLTPEQMHIVEKKGGLVAVVQSVFTVLKPVLSIVSLGLLRKR